MKNKFFNVSDALHIKKICVMCDKLFETANIKLLTCSYICENQYQKDIKEYGSLKNKKRKLLKIPCEICGYNLTVDLHHEHITKSTHFLCPNHHALITRKKATFFQLRNHPENYQNVEKDIIKDLQKYIKALERKLRIFYTK